MSSPTASSTPERCEVGAAGDVVAQAPSVDQEALPVPAAAASSTSASHCAARGTLVRTLQLPASDTYSFAVRADERMLVVGMYGGDCLCVYNLPSGQLAATIGESGDDPGQFSQPFRLCFSPNGNVLVAEEGNKRVQEVKSSGEHVRFIAEGTFRDASPFGVAVAPSGDVIAVSYERASPYSGAGPRVRLFDFSTGAAIAAFGEAWDDANPPGLLSRCCPAIRFTADGTCVLVSEHQAGRLSLFTVAGEFVRCIGAGVLSQGYLDVVLSGAGECVVSDWAGHRVCVFDTASGDLLRTWGVGDAGDEERPYPVALATAGSALYVIEADTGVVRVYE